MTLTAVIGLYRMVTDVYDPALGRFLEVDPVEGGSANDYDYVDGDPVNGYDLAGTFGMPKLPNPIKAVKDAGNSLVSFLHQVAKPPRSSRTNLSTPPKS